MKRNHRRGIAAVLLAGFAGAAAAHTGHGAESLYAGLIHPFGVDHLLVMMAVGLWSVFALPRGRAWQGPGIFVALMVAGAALGAGGLALPWLEVSLAGTVLVMGLMLMTVTRRGPSGLGLGVIAVAALLHGLAHGAEGVGASLGLASYAAGFVATTAALHFGGVMAGLFLRRQVVGRAARAVGGMGLAFGGAGLYLLSQF